MKAKASNTCLPAAGLVGKALHVLFSTGRPLNSTVGLSITETHTLHDTEHYGFI